MSAELDSNSYDPARAQDLAKEFWQLFCLELACQENHGLSRKEIARELHIDSIESAKQSIRNKLLKMDRERARENAEGNETALKAAETLVIPHLDFTVTRNA